MTAPASKPMTLEEGREALRFCNSYNRLPTLIDLAWSLEWADWMTLLGQEWSTCDNIGKWLDELTEVTPFADVFETPALGHWMMTDAEKVELAALPDEVELFRGCYAHNKWGLSWSLDRATAERFPTLNRYKQQGQPLLVRARIAKADIIALKHDRNEAEVIAWRPKHVSTSHVR